TSVRRSLPSTREAMIRLGQHGVEKASHFPSDDSRGSSGSTAPSPITFRAPRSYPKTTSWVVGRPSTVVRIEATRPDESASHVHQTKSSPLASDQPLWSPRRLKNANDCASRSAATATWPLGATRTKYRSVLRGMSSLETSCTSGAGDATAPEGAADQPAAEE